MSSLNSICDTRLFQNLHGNCKYNDRGHCHFLKSVWDIGHLHRGMVVELVMSGFSVGGWATY